MKYLKDFKLFENNENFNDLSEISDKLDEIVDSIDDETIDKFDDLIDDSDITRIINGEISIDDLVNEMEPFLSKNESVLTISALLALKFYISRKIYKVIRHKYPNSFIGRLKQNFDLLTDFTGTYVAFDISHAKMGNSYNKEVINDLLEKLFNLGVKFNEIFIANGRDEKGNINKESKSLIIRSDDMNKISKIIYDSDLSDPNLEHYSGHELKMTFGNINNITNDPFFNYFGKKLINEINPNVLTKIKNYTKNLLSKPEVSQLQIKNSN